LDGGEDEDKHNYIQTKRTTTIFEIYRETDHLPMKIIIPNQRGRT